MNIMDMSGAVCLVTGGAGWYLLVRTVKGRPIYIDLLPHLFAWLRRK